MVNRNVVSAKLAELADRIARVRAHCPASADELRRDRDALDLVAFNLMLAVQSCLDIASHLISDEGWSAAPTLAAAFERLGAEGVLTHATASALARAAGLRNVVAHGYAGIDVATVFRAAREGVADLERFEHELGAWMATRGA